MTEDTKPILANDRFLNASAVREHSLNCSKILRNGKFTRVSEDFMIEVQADIESWIREIEAKCQHLKHPPLACGDGDTAFVTGAYMSRLQSAIDRAVGRLIRSKVCRQPSVGKTLNATR
jgi:hypothetical protein